MADQNTTSQILPEEYFYRETVERNKNGYTRGVWRVCLIVSRNFSKKIVQICFRYKTEKCISKIP